MTLPSLKTCPQSRRKLVCGDFPEVFELLFASNALLIQLIEFETRRHKSLQSGKFEVWLPRARCQNNATVGKE